MQEFFRLPVPQGATQVPRPVYCDLRVLRSDRCTPNTQRTSTDNSHPLHVLGVQEFHLRSASPLDTALLLGHSTPSLFRSPKPLALHLAWHC